MEKDKNIEIAKQILTEYLIKKEHRKTPERYAILEEIYRRDEHFTIEDLFIFMRDNHYRVSKATLYNTLEILIDCKLVIKHQFGSNTAQFEKSITSFKHDHLICTDCGKIIEFYDSEINNIIKKATENTGFMPDNHTFYVYGVCGECE